MAAHAEAGRLSLRWLSARSEFARHEKFFRDEMKAARVVIINTGAPGESIERTYQRIMANLEKA